MSLSEIREAVFDVIGWSPNASEEQVERTNREINRAYRSIALRAPELFDSTGESIWLTAKATPDDANTTDRVSVLAGDPWVLVQDVAVISSARIEPATDGTWDGRIIELLHSDGIWYQRRIRKVFSATVVAVNYVAFSLFEPWLNPSATALEYRIFVDQYYFSPVMLRAIAAQVITDEIVTRPLKVITQAEAEFNGYFNRPELVSGNMVPEFMYKVGREALDTPAFTPTVATNGTWIGPLAGGAFEFCFTVCHGRRNADRRRPGPISNASLALSSARAEPQLESSPSPISAEITAITDGGGIRITVPNYAFMLGFGDNTTARYNQSGMYIRIYVRRLTAVGGSNAAVESRNKFFLLDEVDEGTTTYDWVGVKNYDIQTPLRKNNSYAAFGVWPPPDAPLRLNVRCTERVLELTDESDSSLIDSASDALVYLAGTMMSLILKEYKQMAALKKLFEEEMDTLTEAKGSMMLPNQTFKRRLASKRG